MLLGDPPAAGFTMEELARSAGVSRGTIYGYFPGGRDDVVRTVYLRAADEVLERSQALRSREEGLPGRIAALARGFLEFTSLPEGRFYGLVSPEVAAIVADQLGSGSSRGAELILEDLEDARAAGELTGAVDTHLMSRLISGVLRSAGEESAGNRAVVDALVEQVRLIAQGIAAQPGD